MPTGNKGSLLRKKQKEARAANGKYLLTAGWKRRTVDLFGVTHDAWLSPHTGRVLLMAQAITAQRQRDAKKRRK